MENAVIYARVSSVEVNGKSRQDTERQVEDLTKYANANNINVVRAFKEHISGAKKNSERAVLMECLIYAQEHKTMILFSEISRCSRSVWQTLEIMKHCIDNKIQVFFKSENLYVFDKDGNVNETIAILVSVLSYASQVERKNIQIRLSQGLALYRSKGGKTGRKVGSHIMTKEERARKYKTTISLLRQGLSVPNVVAIANSRGEKVSESTVKRLKSEFIGVARKSRA